MAKSRDPIDQIIDAATESVAWMIASSVENNDGTESPIEKLFLVSLKAAVKYIYPHQRNSIVIAKHPDTRLQKDYMESFVVRPQFQIGSYRVDFLIHAYDFLASGWDDDECWFPYHETHWRSLVVECDGHDFHERTKEQAARDRKRDRELSLKGYDVFRFTGSEIWRDPIKCAEDVIQWARFEP